MYCKRSLQRNIVPSNAINGLVGDDRLAVLEPWRDVDAFPFDWNLKQLQ
jgi:hypothetical protein